MKKEILITFDEYNSRNELEESDRLLLAEAEKALDKSYSPYSNFKVAAAALLHNEQIISAANQENASYPAGICAERNLLAAVSAMHPGAVINTIAITYLPLQGKSNRPVSPCGICRQSIAEYQSRQNKPVRIVLAGLEGCIYIMSSADALLPLTFSSQDLV